MLFASTCPFIASVTVEQVRKLVYSSQKKNKQIKNSAYTYVKDSSHADIHYPFNITCRRCLLDSSWNVMAHGDAWEGKWRGNWRMEWVASTLHTTSEHGVSSITTADAHTSAASRRLNWRRHRFKWTRPFRRMTKSGFRACAITFQTQSSIHAS